MFEGLLLLHISLNIFWDCVENHIQDVVGTNEWFVFQFNRISNYIKDKINV